MEPAKRMKITPTMWDYILDFVTGHPEMATGKFEGPNAKHQVQKLWNELADKLNSLGHGMKTATKWQKSFTDWKYNVKQKYAEIRTQRTKTGGGPSLEKKLTPQEERLMGLIGRSSLEGDGVVEEIGLGSQRPSIPHHLEAGPSTSRQLPPVEEEIIYVTHSPRPIEVVTSEGMSDPPSETSEVLFTSGPSTPQPTTGPSTPQPTTSDTSLPHRTSRRPRGSVLEEFQSETMGQLIMINNNLQSISNNIERLTDAIINFLNKQE